MPRVAFDATEGPLACHTAVCSDVRERLHKSQAARCALVDARAMEEVSLDRGETEPPDTSEPVGTPCQCLVERVWQGDDPLSVGCMGQDVVDEDRCGLGHATGAAARTDKALLAREGDDPVVATWVAAPPREALVRVAAASESFEELDSPGRRRSTVPIGEVEGRPLVMEDEVVFTNGPAEWWALP